jgi:hypothetical protein
LKAAVALVSAAAVGLAAAGGAAARLALLPSPTEPLDARVPLAGAAPTEPYRLPSGRVTNSERVFADVLDDGNVVRVRVIQRLELSGTGDFSFLVPGPFRDVRAGAGSQGEPGLRRSALIWQGFATRRRVLAADAELVPEVAARSLPLRLELRSRREGGRLSVVLRLRNTTATRAVAFSAQARAADMRRAIARIAGQVARGAPVQRTVQVEGPARGLRVSVEAPLRIRGLIRVGGRPLARFDRIVGGPAPSTATIRLITPRAADHPDVVVTAEPAPLVPELRRPPRDANGRKLLLLAERMLLRLARVRQYQAFLASPAPEEPTHTVYRFRTVPPPVAALERSEDDGRPVLFIVLLAAGAVVLSTAAVVLWAHL